MIDIHGEYGNAFKDKAKVFSSSPNKKVGELDLRIPYWGLNYQELTKVIIGSSTFPASQYLKEKILEHKKEMQAAEYQSFIKRENVTIDSPIPFSIHQLWHDLHKWKL